MPRNSLKNRVDATLVVYVGGTLVNFSKRYLMDVEISLV